MVVALVLRIGDMILKNDVYERVIEKKELRFDEKYHIHFQVYLVLDKTLPCQRTDSMLLYSYSGTRRMTGSFVKGIHKIILCQVQ